MAEEGRGTEDDGPKEEDKLKFVLRRDSRSKLVWRDSRSKLVCEVGGKKLGKKLGVDAKLVFEIVVAPNVPSRQCFDKSNWLEAELRVVHVGGIGGIQYGNSWRKRPGLTVSVDLGVLRESAFELRVADGRTPEEIDSDEVVDREEALVLIGEPEEDLCEALAISIVDMLHDKEHELEAQEKERKEHSDHAKAERARIGTDKLDVFSFSMGARAPPGRVVAEAEAAENETKQMLEDCRNVLASSWLERSLSAGTRELVKAARG